MRAIDLIMSNFFVSRILPRGTIPPSAIETLLSGMIVSMLISTIIPSPLQCGQYPCGELNEKECGAGSAMEMPVSGQTRCFEKCLVSDVSMSRTAREPFPRLRADMTEFLIRFSSLASGFSLSITSSMKWALYLSRAETSLRSRISESILACV